MDHFPFAQGSGMLSLLFYGPVLLLILWETFSPRRRLRTSTWIRWLNNTFLWLTGDLLQRLLFAGLIVSVTDYTHRHKIGLINNIEMPEILAVVSSLILLDLMMTLKHRLFHEIPLLWRLHAVHHSDLDCDFSTAVRLHPLDTLVGSFLSLLIFLAVGAPPTAVYIYFLAATVLNPIRHANVDISPSIERVLRLFVVTPDFHRTHHSALQAETNGNYGTVFPWWDWLMKTYCAEPAGGQRDFKIGLEYFRAEEEQWLPRLLSQPFRRQGLQTSLPLAGPIEAGY